MAADVHQFGEYSRRTTVEDDARINAAQHTDATRLWMPDDTTDGEWAVWLPHDCDEWVIAHGDRPAVIAKLTQFRDAVDDAIMWLSERDD